MERTNNADGDTIHSLGNDAICDNFFHSRLYDEPFLARANGIHFSNYGSDTVTIRNNDRASMLPIMATRLPHPKLSRKEESPHNVEGV
jgi:hypothetical protein